MDKIRIQDLIKSTLAALDVADLFIDLSEADVIKIGVVSETFKYMPRIQRVELVRELLDEAPDAVSEAFIVIEAYDLTEWEQIPEADKRAFPTECEDNTTTRKKRKRIA